MCRCHRWAVLVGCALVLCSVAGVGAGTAVGDAGANERPLAEAGLDQTVALDATVHLDATESEDPDGDVVAYEWTVESPAGVEFAPNCPDCARTEFRVTTTGTYVVTVTVTDDDGATQSDTLRVTVESVSPPSVELVGVEEVPAGSVGWLTAQASAGDAPLARLEWAVDGTRVGSDRLENASGHATLIRTFAGAGERRVRARVVDRLGRVGTASLNVTVVPPATDVEAGHGGDNGTESSDGGSGCGITNATATDPCEDQVYFDHSDGTAVLDDGNNDGRYTYRGAVVKTIDDPGRLTPTIRVDQSKLAGVVGGLFDSDDGARADSEDDATGGARGEKEDAREKACRSGFTAECQFVGDQLEHGGRPNVHIR